MMIKTILLVHVLLLTACSTTTNTETFTPLSTNDGQAAVYVYRPSATANAIYSPDLYINDELKLAVKNGKNSRITLAAGEYRFKLDAENNSSNLTNLTLTLNPDTTHYIRVTTSLKIKSSTSYEPYQRKFNMELVDEKPALTEISECCTEKDKKILSTTEESPPDKKITEDGFSVDKTQNPFSH